MASQKSSFSIFPVLKGLKRIKKIKNHSKSFKLVSQSLFKYFQQNPYIFLVLTETLTLSLPVPRWAGDNTVLHTTSNISKTISVNIAFTRRFYKEYSISFLMVCRLIDFLFVVLKLLMFKIVELLASQKPSFSILGLNIFEFSHVREIIESWLVYVNKFSWIIQSCFLTETIKKS